MHEDLKEGVTDSGLQALASVGCGAQLTSLFLAGKLFRVIVVVLGCVKSVATY